MVPRRRNGQIDLNGRRLECHNSSLSCETKLLVVVLRSLFDRILLVSFGDPRSILCTGKRESKTEKKPRQIKRENKPVLPFFLLLQRQAFHLFSFTSVNKEMFKATMP